MIVVIPLKNRTSRTSSSSKSNCSCNTLTSKQYLKQVRGTERGQEKEGIVSTREAIEACENTWCFGVFPNQQGRVCVHHLDRLTTNYNSFYSSMGRFCFGLLMLILLLRAR
ncbi:hypothetical protein POM88_031426 [Heracleum sosnowskyi]|uniref:Uncharacterized protein n=1 Tax=Heracleum sosnowskyi TaxID=360622 RepID=A0AAD8HY90_9APIA|nr:hypothetical protein POM88_031426 [Heracleum sosnowskyi]